MRIPVYTLVAGWLLVASCSQEVVYQSSNSELFDKTWDFVNEHHFFENRQAAVWDSLHAAYRFRFSEELTPEAIAPIFSQLLTEHGDYHTTLKNGSLTVFGQQQSNENAFLYETTAKFHEFKNEQSTPYYNLAQIDGGITYLMVKDFEQDGFDDKMLASQLKSYSHTGGVIVDLRSCTGGTPQGVSIIKQFFSGDRVVYNEKFKTGKGRDDISAYQPIQMAGIGTIPATTQVVCITSSNTYSMGNTIAYILSNLPNVTLLGDKTGGGSGFVQTAILPQGWVISYMVTSLADANKVSMVNGLIPAIELVPSADYWQQEYPTTGRDLQLEAAIQEL